jgi:hypothetical protein
MNKLLALLLSSIFATTAFAASHAGAPAAPGTATTMPEAMKAGDPKAQAAAQAKVDARPKSGENTAKPSEAMKAGNAKAEAAAQAKVDKKAKTGKKNSTDEQMANDVKKL